MTDELDSEIAVDRFEQLMELLHAARIRADINSAVVLWQIGISTMVNEGVTEEKIAGWLKEWFVNKRALDERGRKVGEEIDDFVSSILKEEKPKES